MTNKLTGLVLLAGLASLLAESSSAQSGVTPGVIRTFAFDPAAAGHVLAGGGVGVYSSEDGGASWLLAPRPRVVWSMAVSPASLAVGAASGDVVLAATEFEAVLRSTDGGLSWSAQPDWTEAVRSVAMRADGTAAYAGSENAIYVSDDRGASWRILNDTLGPGVVAGIVLVASDPNLIYVARRGQGVYRSIDRGVSWQLGTAGMDDTYLIDLDIDPSNASVLYATALTGVYRSVDAGTSWQPLAFPPGSYDLAIDATDASRMFVASTLTGIHRSRDGGTSWVRVSGEIGSEVTFFSVGVAPDGSGRVFAGTQDFGILISADDGESWRSHVGAALPGVAPEPGPGPEAAPGSLELSITDWQGGDTVDAGSQARFRLQLTNPGQSAVMAARLHAGWVRLPFLVGSSTPMPKSLSSSRGSCDSTGECVLGSIGPGETVTIEFFGSTASGVLGTYRLSVNFSADNAGGGSTRRDIGSSVTVFSTDSGGGATGLLDLLLLAAVGGLMRRRRAGPAC